ncbi:hypothetical protein Pint_26569 [Pistacia integerrima]|uniref:Uncharacterized protein n=1 Tax=Pistacia integerrima TaxID=434235 RepID=A0ACC0YN70_9ROSI|nr:hypothetical protein Pint_26569 [Pistacia integerrima]
MGEVLELPRSTSELWKINWCKTSWYGMGFDCTTNTYKIVRVMEISHAEFDTEVHTLGTNSWRRIGSNPSCILSNCGVNAYGDMHWLRSNLKQHIEYETMIRSFDFKREEFKWIRYPNLKYFAHKSCIKVPLINLRGSLAIVNVLPYNEMEIWVMKDYDKKEYYWIEFTILMEITNCPSTSGKNKQQCYGNFPTHIVVDIFLRLPVKSLLRFRCVSKMWCSIIDSVSFANMYESARVEEPQILYSPPYLKREFKWTRHPKLEYYADLHKKNSLISLRGSLAIVSILVLKDYEKKDYYWYWVREFRLNIGVIRPDDIAYWQSSGTIMENFGACGHRGLFFDTFHHGHYVIDLQTNHIQHINECIPPEDYNSGVLDGLTFKRIVNSYTRSVLSLRNFGNPNANHGDHTYNFLKRVQSVYVNL